MIASGKRVAALAAVAVAAMFAAPAANAGLVALYQYDNPANLGADSSGKNNNLLASGGASFGAGKFGSGLELNNAAGGMLYSSSGTLTDLPTGGSSYTVSTWINADTAGNGDMGGLVGWGYYGSYGQVNATRFSGTNHLYNYWWADDLLADAGQNLVTGSGAAGWHFVASTYDSATKTNSIYVDNVLRATRTVVTGPNVGAANFAIGRTVGNEYFDGQMDNTAIFDHALSVNELIAVSANDYSAYATTPVPEPVSLALFAAGLLGLGCARRKRSK